LEITASEYAQIKIIKELKLFLENKMTSKAFEIYEENISKLFKSNEERLEVRKIEENVNCLINIKEEKSELLFNNIEENADHQEIISHNLEIDTENMINLCESKYKNLAISACFQDSNIVPEEVAVILKKTNKDKRDIRRASINSFKCQNIYNYNLNKELDRALKDAFICLNKANYEYVAIFLHEYDYNDEQISKSIIGGIESFIEKILRHERKLIIKSIKFYFDRTNESIIEIFSNTFYDFLTENQVNREIIKREDVVKFQFISDSPKKINEARLKIFELVNEKKEFNVPGINLIWFR
jgi:hypothetical protein